MHIEPSCVAEISSHRDFPALCEEYATYSIKSLQTPKFDPLTYEKLEGAGVLTILRAIHREDLIGFVTIVTSIVPHYAIQLSVVESLIVRSSFRKHSAGIQLIRAAERYGENVGSAGLFINCPVAARSLQKLLPRIGFDPQTIHFFKAYGTD